MAWACPKWSRQRVRITSHRKTDLDSFSMNVAKSVLGTKFHCRSVTKDCIRNMLHGAKLTGCSLWLLLVFCKNLRVAYHGSSKLAKNARTSLMENAKTSSCFG